MKRSSERGSAIIMLFIAVALFGMLAYAFTQSSRTSTSWLENEQDKAATTASQDCTNAVDMATKRLEARGCGNDISYNTDGTNNNPDITDGSCSMYHTNGGGIKNCGLSIVCSLAQLSVLAIGESCGSIIYAGLSPDGNRRMYAAANDSGQMSFHRTVYIPFIETPMANCAGSGGSCLTGEDNTTLLANLVDASSPYPAAVACYNLILGGYDDWYLPAKQEMDVIVANAASIANLNMTGNWPIGYYITSSEGNNQQMWVDRPANDYPHLRDKDTDFSVRCVRKD